MVEEIPIPESELTEEEKAFVAKLGQDDLKAIDEALLSNAKSSWRKVAMVVAKTMDMPNQTPGIPATLYSQRLRALVENGHLESQGNLLYRRFSEVRLPGATKQHKT